MNKNEVIEFMQTYQRVTENMFKKDTEICFCYNEFK